MVQYRANGKTEFESSASSDEGVARKKLRKRLGEIADDRFVGPDAERVSLAELCDDVISDYRVNERDSIDKAERSAKRIKEFFGNAKAHSVKGDKVKKFTAWRQEQGAENGTINRELAS